MSIISFQPHTLFEQSQFHTKKVMNADESHGSVHGAGATANKAFSNEGINQELSGGAKDFSNQEEASNEGPARSQTSEQSIKVEQQQFHNYKFKIAPQGETKKPVNQIGMEDEDHRVDLADIATGRIAAEESKTDRLFSLPVQNIQGLHNEQSLTQRDN